MAIRDDHVAAIRRAFPYAEQVCRRVDVDYMVPVGEKLVTQVEGFLRRLDEDMAAIGLGGAVVGLSSGVDSLVCALLAHRALGAENVCKVIVDQAAADRPSPGSLLTLRLAKELGGPVVLVSIAEFVAEYRRRHRGGTWYQGLNAQTRLVQGAIFDAADQRAAWVISTVDRSERLLARHSEHFYGHAEPLADLYKTEVYEVYRYLGGAGTEAQRRAGCTRWLIDHDSFWDDELFGATWEVIDPVLHLLSERCMTAEEVAESAGLDAEWVRGIVHRMQTQVNRMTTRRLVGVRVRPDCGPPRPAPGSAGGVAS